MSGVNVMMARDWFWKPSIHSHEPRPKPPRPRKEDERIALLRGLYQDLPRKDWKFAKSLIRQYDGKGWLSKKQWYWVDTMNQIIRGKV